MKSDEEAAIMCRHVSTVAQIVDLLGGSVNLPSTLVLEGCETKLGHQEAGD